MLQKMASFLDMKCFTKRDCHCWSPLQYCFQLLYVKYLHVTFVPLILNSGTRYLSGWNSSCCIWGSLHTTRFLSSKTCEFRLAISCSPPARVWCENLMKSACKLGKIHCHPINVGACVSNWRDAAVRQKARLAFASRSSRYGEFAGESTHSTQHTKLHPLEPGCRRRAHSHYCHPHISGTERNSLYIYTSGVQPTSVSAMEAGAKLNSAQFVHFVHDSANCFAFGRSR